MCESMADVYNWDKGEALKIAQTLIKDNFTNEEQTIIIDFLSNALKNDLAYL